MTDLGLPHLYSGKVRDIYDAGDGRLLMVTSDRISAFDVVMAEPIPDKGRVLTAMSAFWFEQFADVVGEPPASPPTSPTCPSRRPATRSSPGRVMLCREAEMLPIECIVRGYITGSAWKEYQADGHHARRGAARGPAGVRRSCPSRCSPRRPRPTIGDHDDEHLLRRGRRPDRRASWPSGPATSRSSSTSGAPSGPPSAASSSPTPSSSSAWSTASWSWPTRCSPRTRRGSGRPTSGRPGSTPPVVRQAAGPRLPRRRSTGTSSPPPPPLPAEVVERHPRPLRRGLRAHHRPVLRRLARRDRQRRLGTVSGARRRCGRVRAMIFAVSGRGAAPAGDRRPAGRHHRAVPARPRVRRRRRRAGRQEHPFSIDAADEAAARAEVDDLCRRFLTNPVIEDATVTVHRGRGGGADVSDPGRRRPVPRLELRARRRSRPSRPLGGDAEILLARRRRPSAASTRSSSPAASPTATTCAPAPSPASRR